MGPPPGSSSTRISNENSPSKKSVSSKKNAPSKNKLVRSPVLKSSVLMQSAKNKQCFPLYVVSAREGIAMAFISRPNKIDHQGFTGSIFRTFRENEEVASKCDVSAVLVRRKAAELAYNECMMASPRMDEPYYFNMFVKVYRDPNDNNHINNAKWGKQLAASCNEIATEFKFPTFYAFKCNLTDAEEPLPPVNTYVLNKDVMYLMDLIYPPETYSREEQADNLIPDFFGDDLKARDFILNFNTSV
jgi:hypothetical protein